VNPVICTIGKLSFSIYLAHWVSLALVTPIAEKVLLAMTSNWPFRADWVHYGCFLALVVSSVLLAWPLNVWVERPGVRLGQRIIARLRQDDEPIRSAAP
jgi:peptidoglycan/LPS O-acetylase OafA/YrhL